MSVISYNMCFQIDYTVQKDTVKRSGKKDGCKLFEGKSREIEMGLEILGLPKSCPINKVRWSRF